VREPSVASPPSVSTGGVVPRSTAGIREHGSFPNYRDPTKWYSKLFIAALALFFFMILATAAISGYLVYRMISQRRAIPIST